jgi:hypothetical protein
VAGRARAPSLCQHRRIEWLFRNRRTGEITVAQVPNLPLIVFLVAFALRWLLDPSGDVRTGLDVVATVALAIWAGDEILRGVNPFRRVLGAVVLGGLVFRMV